MTEEERHNREIFSRTGALYAQFLDHQDEKRADQLAAIMKKRLMKRFISRLPGIIRPESPLY